MFHRVLGHDAGRAFVCSRLVERDLIVESTFAQGDRHGTAGDDCIGHFFYCRVKLGSGDDSIDQTNCQRTFGRDRYPGQQHFHCDF